MAIVRDKLIPLGEVQGESFPSYFALALSAVRDFTVVYVLTLLL